ncbi:MAG: hypothetical protein ABI550_01385 [Ignavibacteriaceae bacterium]
MKINIKSIIGMIMILVSNIFSQNSFGLNGYWGNTNSSSQTLNNFEANPSNFSLLKDWGINFSYGAEFSGEVNSNLYLLSLSKKIKDHTFSLRYTPGYQKEFIFTNSESIFLNDSTTQQLSSDFIYKELFGFGYSYNFSNEISAGYTLRFFNQEFNQESVVPVFSDTLYFERRNDSKKLNFWKFDFGINYFPLKNLSIEISSINLLNFNQSIDDSTISKFEIKRKKGALFGISYSPISSLTLNALYETSNSLQIGANNFFKIFDNQIGVSVNAVHDEEQAPFIAGIIPSLTYSTKLFSVSLSAVKYFSDRNITQNFSDFENGGLTNIINNRYSFDKVVLSAAFTLNTIKEPSVELLDVEVLKDIFPTLSENYLDHPFAVGKVVNLTDKPITVKPMSKIEGINTDLIQSAPVIISAKDTAEINFYTIIPEDYSKDKAEISYADFYVSETEDELVDKNQKPVLINSINAWDGRVINLKYFIKKDLNFAISYSKKILSEHKSELDTLSYALSVFYKAKLIFVQFAKEMVYTSDPRASAEYVQFPHQTLEVKGGDCDDLSVCLSSLLESVGIETALVDYKNVDNKTTNGIRHVNILVNTELAANQASLITQNDSKYFLRRNNSNEDKIWIPIEATSLTDFQSAWEVGSDKFNNDAIKNLGLAKNEVEIIDIN